MENEEKNNRDPIFLFIQHTSAVLHAEFDIKILKNELKNWDKAQEQCTFLFKILQKMWKEKEIIEEKKKEVIFHFILH